MAEEEDNGSDAETYDSSEEDKKAKWKNMTLAEKEAAKKVSESTTYQPTAVSYALDPTLPLPHYPYPGVGPEFHTSELAKRFRTQIRELAAQGGHYGAAAVEAVAPAPVQAVAPAPVQAVAPLDPVRNPNPHNRQPFPWVFPTFITFRPGYINGFVTLPTLDGDWVSVNDYMLPRIPLPYAPDGAKWFGIRGGVRQENTAALYTYEPRVRVGGEREDNKESLQSPRDAED
jgi:hypothetical protein